MKNRIQASSLTKQESEELIHRLFEKLGWMTNIRDEQILLGEVIQFLGLESNRVTEIALRKASGLSKPRCIFRDAKTSTIGWRNS